MTETEYEELDARIQLLLRNEDEASELELPAIVCREGRAWIEWNGKLVRILGHRALVDEAVDVVERQLHDADRGAHADAMAMEQTAVAAGEPVLTSPASEGDPLGWDASGGGIAIGIETELPGGTLPTVIGPAFSFAGSLGPLLVGGREAFRFGTASLNVLLMDFEALVGYGAPLDPDKTFGIEARVGAEWMVLYPDGNYGVATLAPIASLGLRASTALGIYNAWAGLDVRFRPSPLSLQLEEEIRGADVSVSVTIGWAYAVWTEKTRK